MNAESEDRSAPLRPRDVDFEGVRAAMEALLRSAGLDEAADGNAPDKAASAWSDHLLVGYGSDPVEVLRPTWPDRSGHMVTVRGIPFVSVCAHHLLPFFGKAYVAYLPDTQLTGLSRIEKMIHCLSRRLQLQERLGEEIADALVEATGARGVACVLEAEHMCVFARGQRQRGTDTQTFCFRGELERDPTLQERSLRWLLSGSRER
ncbi:MAG: GTP cyclohydrolase I [Acidobacteriota bacterium]